MYACLSIKINLASVCIECVSIVFKTRLATGSKSGLKQDAVGTQMQRGLHEKN